MTRTGLIEEPLTHSVIGAFYDVYNALGFGFLEHLYVMALERELRARGHVVALEVAVRVMYKGCELGTQRIDMIVDDKVIVETKSTPQLPRAAARQLYNYLRAAGIQVGLLLHFGPEPKLCRLVCEYPKKNPRNPLNPLNLVQLSDPDPTLASVKESAP